MLCLASRQRHCLPPATELSEFKRIEATAMKKHLRFWLSAASLAITTSAIATTSQADTVAIPVGQQTVQSTLTVPRSGMSKASVERRYGAPNQRQSPVGDPPISSWTYNGFTVYFEYDHVIHTVIQHKPNQG